MNVIMKIILAQRITDTNKQNVFVIPKYWLLITQIKMFPINARCFLLNDYLEKRVGVRKSLWCLSMLRFQKKKVVKKFLFWDKQD